METVDKQDETIVIIDVSSYIFRAFFALPPMISPKNEPVNAIYGFISMFLKTMEKFKGCSAVAALDSKSETFRKRAYPQYKSNRKEVDPALKSQFVYIEKMLKVLNVPVFAADGFEADDVIASFVARHSDKKIVIVSSDKDLTQLVADKVLMYDGMRDKFIDAFAVNEKYGVFPEKMLEFLTLTGDASDNVPGVPGVGPKSAAKLLNQYGTIENIYKNLGSLPPAMKNKFIENRRQIEISKYLITLKNLIKLDNYEFKAWAGIDEKQFVDFASEFGFHSLIKRIKGGNKTKIEKNESLKKLKGDETKEENGDSPIKLVPWVESYFMPGERETLFAIFFENKFYIGRNGKFILFSIDEIPAESLVYSFEIKDFLNVPFPEKVKFVDLQTAYFCIDSGRHGYSLDKIAGFCNFQPSKIDSVALCFAFLERLADKIAKFPEQSFLINEIETPHLEVVKSMELAGIKVDLQKAAALKEEFSAVIADLSRQIRERAGSDFNPNSPKQLQEILFDKLKFKGGKKIKSGYSTDRETLSRLAEQNRSPLPALILENRKYSKLVSTYLDPIVKKTDRDRRLRTSYLTTYAATGRLASREPNLQNIPTRDKEGERIREIFIAEKGFKLLSLDYSQIELRILALLSQEPEFIEAFNKGEDIHTLTAAAIFGIHPLFVDKEMRRNAKAVNFGIIYGMQAYKLSMDTGVDFAFAKKYIDDYFACYPKIKNFIDATIKSAKEKGYVETLFKRRRYIPELNSTSKKAVKSGERMAVNTLIQGSAADIIKLGATSVYRMLRQRRLKARILLQIHDELIIEIPENDDEIIQACIDKMKNLHIPGVELNVPIELNFSVGDNWAELK